MRNITGYVQAIENGVYTISQAVEIVAESATTALLACGNGLGFVAVHRAMDLWERGIPLHTRQYEAIVATARRIGAQVFI